MALLEISDLRKAYGQTEVLKKISLDINRGEVIAIIGKSGSGKSTFLRCLNGLETPTSGTVRIDGLNLTLDERALKELRLKVGMIFQQFNLFPHLSALDNVALAPRIVTKQTRFAARAKARIMLEKVGLGEREHARPRELSGGQQQRVAIARALAMEPIILLCDEITSALDPELVGEVLNVVKKLAAEGMTLLMVTHEMRFARDVCSRVVFMHAGQIHEIGPPGEIFTSPKTPELKQSWSQLTVHPTAMLARKASFSPFGQSENFHKPNLLAVTSADRLNAGWTGASRARERGLANAKSHVERLLEPLLRHCGIVTVADAHPAGLSWLGSVHGHKTRSLGVEHFGQSATINRL